MLQVVTRRLWLKAVTRRSFTSYNFLKYASSNGSRIIRKQTKEEFEQTQLQEDLKSPNRFIRWGAVARTDEFRKGMTKYLIGLYALFIFFGLQRMNKLYYKEKETEALKERNENKELNDYEEVKLKSLSSPMRMRTRDKLKLDQYESLKEECEKNEEPFDGNQFKNVHFGENHTNENILPARDTTEFYDDKAIDYDSGVDFEEKMVFMGRRRKWLMNQIHGDVLEVSCGTGRNIKYLNPEQINSITYLDSSKNMINLTREKFKSFFPNFGKVAFVCGKAEDLMKLSGSKTQVKYDTIVETFGLCSHEDPVAALNNFNRLLKPGGRIILLEHGRGEYDFINNVLDTRAERRLKTWGCRWNLDIGELLDDSDLDIVLEKRVHLGTTWCIVAKRPDDNITKQEIGFIDKYIRSGVKQKIEHMKEDTKEDNPNNKKE